jgi:hypothetical protein
MPELSRRTLLLGATTLVIIPAGRASAHSVDVRPDGRAPGAWPPGEAAGDPRRVGSGVLGPLRIAVLLGAGIDAVGLRVTLVNTGTTSQTVTALLKDLPSTKTRRRTVTIPAGRTRSKTFYGHLNHSFTIQFCLADGVTCLTLGPIGPQPRSVDLARRPHGLSVPPQTAER